MNGSVAPPPHRRALLWRIQLAALVLISVFGAIVSYRAFQDFVMEDSYITLRYARNLVDGHGFVFTPGERVLGTTTPLYTLILAFLGFLGADIAVASDVLFAVCVGSLALVGGLLLRRLGTGSGAILFALLTVYGIDRLYFLWGMETALVMGLVLGATLLAMDRRYVMASVLAALAFLTRYDAALFAISLYVIIFIRERRVPWKPGWIALGIVLPWLVFSQLYFGSVLPNTLDAKTGEISFTEYFLGVIDWNRDNLWTSLRFLQVPPKARAPIAFTLNILILIGLVSATYRIARAEKMPAVLLLFSAGLLVGYSLIGPPLAFFWYLMPAAYFGVLLGLFGWSGLLDRFAARRHAAWALLVLSILSLLYLPQAMAVESESYTKSPQYQARVSAYEDLAVWILENELSDQKLLTLEPGYLTYRTGSPAVDGAGLVTKGVYFHGDRAKRTNFSELIERSSPGLIVKEIPYVPPDFVLVYSTLPRMRLHMEREIYMKRFPEIVQRYLAPPSPGEIEDAVKHPFLFDVGKGSKKEWAAAGGTLFLVGTGLPLTIGGAPVTERYLLHKQQIPGAVSGSETAPFLIDFDRLVFRFAGSHPDTTVAQLVIKGQVVMTLGGESDSKGSEFPFVSLPTRPWRGQIGKLRFVLSSLEREHWLAADEISSVEDTRWEMFDDFEPRIAEDGSSDSSYGPKWSQPFPGKPQRVRPTARGYGLDLLTTMNFAASRGLEGEQEMISEPFLVDHDRMEFLMFDFGGSPTSISLEVEGEVVAQQYGKNKRRLRPVHFDLEPHRGKEAVLRIVDSNPSVNAWIGLDEVRLLDLQERETQAR